MLAFPSYFNKLGRTNGRGELLATGGNFSPSINPRDTLLLPRESENSIKADSSLTVEHNEKLC